MKKILCLVLSAIIFILHLNINVLASDFNATEKSSDSVSTTLEEKKICKADINENFMSDSVIIELDNKSSTKLKEYTAQDFAEVSAVSVRNLSSYTTEKIKQQRIKEKSLSRGEIESLKAKDEFYIDEGKYHQFWLITLDKSSKQNVLDCIKILEKRDDILMASPDYYTTACSTVDKTISTPDENLNVSYPNATPSDPGISTQWAINKINLPSAWNITTGSTSVKVGIIDTGIQGSHPDLTNRVDRTLSRDFTGGNSPLTDPSGHGTHIAGIIGAQPNNSIGVSGVCWNVSLVSLKAAIYDNNDDEYVVNHSRLENALDYAQANSIPIISFSYGAKGNSSGYTNMISGYSGLFVCSAGNYGEEITHTNPHLYSSSHTDNMISVANTNEFDYLYSGSDKPSNYGKDYVHLAAPGTGIYSTYKGGTYVNMTGTSMAAPYVAGVAALLKSKYPEMTTRTLKWHITTYVDSIPALSGKVSSGGRLNAYKALNNVIEYTVRYMPNGGSGTMAATKVIYNNFTPLRANTFTNSNAGFVGWYGRRESDNKWCYTNGTYTNWYAEGSQPAGYYKYLYEDEQIVYNSTGVDGDVITLFAQWRIQYNLNFNGNTGTGSMTSIAAEVGVPFTLPANTFQKQGYYFDYWYAKNQDGEVFCVGPSSSGWYLIENKPTGLVRKSLNNNEVISEYNLNNITHGDNITLYAHWEPVGGMLGDVDMDGAVSVKDASLVQRHVGGLTELSQTQIYIADVDYDGVITVTDASNIQKYSSGLIEYWDN